MRKETSQETTVFAAALDLKSDALRRAAFDLNRCSETFERLSAIFESIEECVQQPDKPALANGAFLLACVGAELSGGWMQRCGESAEFVEATLRGEVGNA